MMFIKIRLEFYIPNNLEDTEDIKKRKEILRKVKDSLKTEMKKLVVVEKEEKNSEFKILLELSISKRIRLKCMRKSKFLYPHFVVYENDKSIKFYPQARAEQEAIIKEFLEEFLNGGIRRFYEKFKIENELKDRENYEN